MTKWYKYRDLKPSVKDILKNKEKSSESIIKSRIKISDEKLILVFRTSTYYAREELDSLPKKYADFSRINDKVCLPLHIGDDIENHNYMLGIENSLKAVKKAHDKINIWVYITIYEEMSKELKVMYKARLMDFKVFEEASTSLDIARTIDRQKDLKSKAWIVLSSFRRLSGLDINKLELIEDQKSNLKEKVIHSDRCVFMVRRLSE